MRKEMGNGKTMRTSSSRSESGSGHRPSAKRSVGCISGIFHFFSRHHSHSRKRLTTASKKENAVISPLKRNEAACEGKKRDAYLAVTAPSCVAAPSGVAEIRRRRSCDAPRSPTIPAEIRRSCSAAASPRGAAPAPALVARLMGLDAPAPAPAPPNQHPPPRSSQRAPPETAAEEKRRKLLGALERCDEDLKALRRIIEAVRSAEMRVKAPGAAGSDGGDSRMERGIRWWEGKGELPSPNSVLDAISSPRFRSKRVDEFDEKRTGAATTTVGSRIVKPSRMGVAFSGRHNKKNTMGTNEPRHIIHRPTTIEEGLPSMNKEAKAFDGVGTDVGGGCPQRWRRRRRSHAMAQSVEQVWEEGVWEEKWELGRMVVGMEWDILDALVEDMVFELLLSDHQFVWNVSLMPLMRRCRKRLCF